MERLLGRFSPQLYAILRIIAGLMWMMHGTQKLFSFPDATKPAATKALQITGGWIEVVAGAMLVVGLFAGLAAFIASGTMAVAYFYSHASGGFFPLVNRGELAVLYCFLYLYMAAHGAGIWSIDALRARGRAAVIS